MPDREVLNPRFSTEMTFAQLDVHFSEAQYGGK
jgi:hypothetical protein